MKNKFLLLVVALTALTIIFTGCSNDFKTSGLKPPQDNQNDTILNSPDEVTESDIEGEILEIDTENVLRLLIDSKADVVSGQVWVTLDENTEYVNSQGTSFTPEDTNTLFEVGEVASIASNGTIMESYPMQTSAVKVFLNSEDN